MNELNISLKQLRYYLVAARLNSLRKAARELKISQLSLSAQVQNWRKYLRLSYLSEAVVE